MDSSSFASASERSEEPKAISILGSDAKALASSADQIESLIDSNNNNTQPEAGSETVHWLAGADHDDQTNTEQDSQSISDEHNSDSQLSSFEVNKSVDEANASLVCDKNIELSVVNEITIENCGLPIQIHSTSMADSMAGFASDGQLDESSDSIGSQLDELSNQVVSEVQLDQLGNQIVGSEEQQIVAEPQLNGFHRVETSGPINVNDLIAASSTNEHNVQIEELSGFERPVEQVVELLVGQIVELQAGQQIELRADQRIAHEVELSDSGTIAVADLFAASSQIQFGGMLVHSGQPVTNQEHNLNETSLSVLEQINEEATEEAMNCEKETDESPNLDGGKPACKAVSQPRVASSRRSRRQADRESESRSAQEEEDHPPGKDPNESATTHGDSNDQLKQPAASDHRQSSRTQTADSSLTQNEPSPDHELNNKSTKKRAPKSPRTAEPEPTPERASGRPQRTRKVPSYLAGDDFEVEDSFRRRLSSTSAGSEKAKVNRKSINRQDALKDPATPQKTTADDAVEDTGKATKEPVKAVPIKSPEKNVFTQQMLIRLAKPDQIKSEDQEKAEQEAAAKEAQDKTTEDDERESECDEQLLEVDDGRTADESKQAEESEESTAQDDDKIEIESKPEEAAKPEEHEMQTDSLTEPTTEEAKQVEEENAVQEKQIEDQEMQEDQNEYSKEDNEMPDEQGEEPSEDQANRDDQTSDDDQASKDQQSSKESAAKEETSSRDESAKEGDLSSEREDQSSKGSVGSDKRSASEDDSDDLSGSDEERLKIDEKPASDLSKRSPVTVRNHSADTGKPKRTAARSAAKRNVPSSDEEDEDEEEEDSDEDPNKLWCICRKPFGNRFMIQCDQCKEW